MDIHQQTGLAAGTIANDDELSAEFSRHGVGLVVGCVMNRGEIKVE